MFRPPQSPLAALAATTVVVTAALCWAAWRLLDQQRAIDEQRAREQLDSSADAIASRISGSVAEVGGWLTGWVSDPSSPPPLVGGAVAVAIGKGGVQVVPAGGLPFVPAVGSATRTTDAFAAGERAEFAVNRLVDAVGGYRRLARSQDVQVRAGALLRLGRVLRKQRDFPGALAAYEQLAALGAARTDDLPAELAGLEGQRAVYAAAGDREGERRAGARVLAGLDGGRWLITRGMAEFLRGSVSSSSRPDSWQLADALSDVWHDAGGRFSARGQRLLERQDRRLLVFWRSSGMRSALLAAFADRFLSMPASVGTPWQLVDPEGQPIVGAAAASGRPVTRIIGTSEHPWTLHAWPSTRPSAGARSSRTILIMMTTATLVFVWAAAFFIGRAIRREAEVARLQSNFVAAVSHEFRSPLTAVRQMAEMLEMDRLPTDERRHAYYRTIAHEAARLQRLVESLLTFGKVEANAARYRFTEVDLGALVRDVVRDSESQARDAGSHIELCGPEDGIRVLADESALAVAVRNLIDNAIKYSPGQSTVSVRCSADHGRAAISVIDRGAGVARRDQRRIFRKFVRGPAAAGAVPGTGIGLTMVQEIVRAHAGEVRVDSEVGRGSTFTIVLPRAEGGRDRRMAD